MSMFHELMMKKKGMPSRYQEVEYIESTGTQYIDTGIVRYIDHTYRYVGEVSFSDITNRQVMGVQGNAYFGVIDGKYQIGNSGTDTVGINAVLNTFVPFDITYDIPNRTIYYSIAEYLNLSRSQTMLNDPPLAHFCLFSLNNGVLPCSWKLKPTQIYDNGRLVRNYIPVYDTETQKYGMWESVQGKFYGNDGTGDFKGSIVGYTIVGSPTITDGVVSGFTTSNYLETQGNFPLQANNFEIFTRIKDTATNDTTRYCVAGNARTSFIIGIKRNSANTFTFILYGGNSTGTGQDWNKKSEQITIDETQFFDVKFTYNGSEYALYINGTKIISYTSTTALYGNAPVSFGRWNYTDVGVFVGEIDINNTYFKVNNKLWFNGQPS